MYTYSGTQSNAKSVNAVRAEADDRLSATALARRLRVRPAAVRAILAPSEWHHTGKFAAETDFYDGAVLIPLAEGDEAAAMERVRERADEVDEGAAVLMALAAAELKAMRSWNPPTRISERVHDDCTIRWTEWEGRFANHRRPIERVAEGVRATVKGKWIAFPYGAATVRKRIDGGHIHLTLGPVAP